MVWSQMRTSGRPASGSMAVARPALRSDSSSWGLYVPFMHNMSVIKPYQCLGSRLGHLLDRPSSSYGHFRRSPGLLSRPVAAAVDDAGGPDVNPAAIGMSLSQDRKVFILDEMTVEQLNDFHMRLCENDVEYHDLKSMCKLNGLGGKDMKYNLRAKLIRKVREMLGKPVWDRRSYGRRVKLPSIMSDNELAKFYKQREVVMPDDKEDAIGLAFAMLVVDGAISQDVVPTTSAYDKLNTKRLIQICQKRNLPTKGNKAELLARLVDYDAQRERKVLADKAADAARRELEQATIDVPPRPPNRAMAADLREAQNTMASVSEMDLPYLRATLLGRNLPVYGTSEVLIDRLTGVLRKDVIDAHAGLGRMIKYAEAAVSKLNDEEIYEALAARGLASFSVGEDSGSRLANALVEEWIHDAMMPNPDDWDTEDDASQPDISPPKVPLQSEDDDAEVIDPTLNVVLLCDGVTELERDRAVRAAREMLPNLQSDQIWGTLMPFTSNKEGDAFEDEVFASSDCDAPPCESVDILYLTPSVNGVVATLSSPLAPLGSIFRVRARPLDGSDAPVVVSNGLSQDIVIKGLKPGTEYEFSAVIVNKLGEGPAGESYHAATLLRQGVSVTVLYPMREKDGKKLYTELSWEELYGWSAGAMDSLLHRDDGKRLAVSVSDLKSNNSIVLPLGYVADPDASLESVSALSSLSEESRHVMLEKVSHTGFQPVPLLHLSDSTAEISKEKIKSWSNDSGADGVISRFKVRVVDNTGSCALSAVCRGLEALEEIIESIKADTGDLKDWYVDVEMLPKDAICLEVNVIGTAAGPVALVPTEMTYFDIGDYIETSDIEIAKLGYLNGDYDVDMIERVVNLKREDVLIPAGHDSRDRDLSRTRSIRHLTPPRSIPVDLMNHARLAACKLFNELKLRDFAKISILISPDIDKGGLAKDKLALEAFESGAKKVIQDADNYTSIKIESLSSLMGKQEAALSVLKAAESSLVDSVADGSFPLEDLSSKSSSRYGDVFGISIDDRTRLDILAEMTGAASTPIQMTPPLATYDGINEPDAIIDPNRLDYFELYVSNIETLPDFDCQIGVLGQQLVASGLSWNWLPKHLISLAAARQGLPPLQDQQVSTEEINDGDEDWVGISEVDPATEVAIDRLSMSDIAQAIAQWEQGPELVQDVELDVQEKEVELTYDDIARDDGMEAALEQSVAALNETDDTDSSGDDEIGDVSEILSQQFPGLHPCRQRVWILCGGEGYQRDESLKAAAATMRALQGAPDLLLETFMLDPPNTGISNDKRLMSLVNLREDVLKSGGSDSFLASEVPYMHPAQIKYPMMPLPGDLNRRGVWRLAGSNVIRETVEDMRISIDRTCSAHKLTTVSRSAGDDLHQIEQITYATKSSLEQSGAIMDGVRAPWGGSLHDSCAQSIPKYLSLRDWAIAASEKCAVVLTVLPGHPSAYGPIQDLMDEIGVPYTGPSMIASELCHERPDLLRSLTDAVNYDGSIISAPPAHSISALELRATCQSEESAQEFFSRLFGAWENKMMVIRPATDCGIGILRMKSGRDLITYHHAIQHWCESIASEDCEAETDDVQMPLPPPTQFVIEPFLAAEPVQLVSCSHKESKDEIDDPIYGRLRWNSMDSWLEVKGSLLGGAGTMRCLGLSTSVTRLRHDGSNDSLFDISPLPVSILSAETAGDTMLRLQLVSDRLGLSGAAEISLLVNTASGEIVINDVNVHPDLSPDGLLMRHAALLSPPMSHVEVLRELLKEAMSRGEQSLENDSVEPASMYPVDEFSASLGGILDAPDAPNPTQNYFGDPYLKVEDGYQYGFEGVGELNEDDSDEEEYDFSMSDDEF
jgi:D-alanine-D-alanine ligase-like ATP-grasp enzyme